MEQDTEVIKLIDFFDHFKQRPGMYIGKPSIDGLQCFLAGIEACRYVNKEFKHPFPHFYEFEEWLRKKIRRNFPNGGSTTEIFRESKGDDEKAFHLWIERYSEFKDKKETKCVKS